MTWAFVLEERAVGSTRLIVRVRAGRSYSFYGLPAWIGMPAVRLAHAIMERKQLHGVASRVESRHEAGDNSQLPQRPRKDGWILWRFGSG